MELILNNYKKILNFSECKAISYVSCTGEEQILDNHRNYITALTTNSRIIIRFNNDQQVDYLARNGVLKVDNDHEKCKVTIMANIIVNLNLNKQENNPKLDIDELELLQNFKS